MQPADIAAEKAVLLAVAQDTGVLEELRKEGMRREWFFNGPIRKLVEAAMRLHLQGKEVSLLSLMSHCNSDLSTGDWETLAATWEKARAGEPVSWRQFVPSLKEYALLREVDGILLDLKEQRQQAPHEVSRWMPHFLQRIRSALEAGADYDPTPSAIWLTGVPTKVIASTGIPVLDEAYRGGLRNGMLVVWVAPTGTGKSRLTYTMAAHGVSQKLRIAVVSTEARPFDVVAGALQAYGGFSDKEIENKQGGDEGRDDLLRMAISDLDKYLYVWGRDCGKKDRIEEILHWIRPTHLVLDHLLPMAKQHGTKYQKQHEIIADFADYLESAAAKHQCTITVFSQLSGENAKKMIKDHDLPSAAAFGSAVPEQAASIGIVSMRHWSKPNALFAIVKKDRISGMVDTHFELRHDPETHTFFEPVSSHDEVYRG